MDKISQYFEFQKSGTSFKTEVSAGLATFFTMSYIIFVQPMVLSAAGMDAGAVFTATCLASALACFIMGIYANYPIAQAPLMGENFFFTYTVVLTMGYSWQQALALVFISGVLFLLLTMTKVREKLVDAVPDCLKYAIACGIGLFVALIGLKEAGIISADPATLMTLGEIHSKPVLVSIGGLLVIAALFARKVKGAVLIGIIFSSVLAFVLGLSHFSGFVSLPPSLEPTFMKLDLSGLLNIDAVSVIIIFLFMAIFDTLGTLVGVGVQAKLMKNGKLERVSKALVSDAAATTVGSLLGTSTVSSYIESSVGVANGGKTGFVAIVVGFMFLASLFISPFVSFVNFSVDLGKGALHPVTAPALIFVGSLMMGSLRHINWDDFTDFAPAFLTMVLIPFTFNIADGIAFGFISYAAIKSLSGRGKEVSFVIWILAALFSARYIFLK
ncbi:MAG: NCS2 family permease [Elusimicrobia bacterium]|nr:NCS2 family permease [Elusimicrobiota bacterium]